MAEGSGQMRLCPPRTRGAHARVPRRDEPGRNRTGTTAELFGGIVLAMRGGGSRTAMPIARVSVRRNVAIGVAALASGCTSLLGIDGNYSVDRGSQGSGGR